VIGWPLQPLLELRTREEETALGGLARAEGALRRVEAGVKAARWALAEAAERAARVEWSVGPEAMGQADLAGAARFREVLRRELARRRGLLDEVEGRARPLQAEARRWRERAVVAAVRRAAVAELGAAWRRERVAAQDRRAEAALDDRPWPARRAR